MNQINKNVLAKFGCVVLGVGFLRLLLALSVVLEHTHSGTGIPLVSLVKSNIAVQSFFIISGFYMAMILTEKYKKYSSFILNRFLRIFPLYLVILALTIVASFILTSIALPDILYKVYSLNPFLFILSMFPNLFIFGQDALFFIRAEPLGFMNNFYTQSALDRAIIVPPAWSLSLELMFYLIAPFLVKIKNKTLFCLILAGLFFRIGLYYLLNENMRDAWLYRFFLAELIFFLVGIASFRLYKFISNINANKVVLASISIIFFLFLGFYDAIPLYSIPKKFLFFTLLAVALPMIFALTKTSKFDRYIGDLSYPVYLSHVLIGSIILPLKISNEFWGIKTAIISLAVSVILLYFVVRPIDAFRKKRLQSV